METCVWFFLLLFHLSEYLFLCFESVLSFSVCWWLRFLMEYCPFHWWAVTYFLVLLCLLCHMHLSWRASPLFWYCCYLALWLYFLSFWIDSYCSSLLLRSCAMCHCPAHSLSISCNFIITAIIGTCLVNLLISL